MASANLKPSSTTHTVLLRQNDASFTAFELTDAAPYRIVRTRAHFEKQLRGCPAAPVQGFDPTERGPESFAPLRGGGYLWVHGVDPGGQVGSYSAIVATVFDASLNFVSEAKYAVRVSDAMAVADLNGDGLPDIFTTTPLTRSSSGMQVLLGKGGANFQDPVTYNIDGSVLAFSIQIADLNGDGKLDVVVASALPGGGKISVFLGNGDGTLQPERVVASGNAMRAVAIGDLNHDGRPDLAYTIDDPSANGPVVAVALGGGDGSFGLPTRLPVGGTDAIAIDDIDGDGNLDVVTSGFTILFGDGKGQFPRRADYLEQVQGSIILTDFDGDGKLDIVTGMGSGTALAGPVVAVLFGSGGAFGGPRISLVHGLPQADNGIYDLVAADLDHDGIPDLLVQELDDLEVVQGTGDGTFRGRFSYFAGNGQFFRAVAVADFDHDGKPDIVDVIDGIAPRVELMLGKGDGTFQPPVSMAIPAHASAMNIGDFNGDGRPDVAIVFAGDANGGAPQLGIYLGDGAGGLRAPVGYNIRPASAAIAVGDFNGDGRADLAIGANGGGVSLYFGKGDGTFGPAVAVSVGNVVNVVTADFNRDGVADLAVLRDQRVSILLGRGDGTFRPVADYDVSNTSQLQAVDLDGDGNLDLLSGNQWLLGNGDGTFGLQSYPLISPVIAVDVNRDGKMDLVGGVSTAGVATLVNISQPAPLTVVNGASFELGPIAPESIATAFGKGLAGALVTVGGIAAQVLYSDARQVNFVVPVGIPAGTATVAANGLSAGVPIAPIASAVFTQDSSGLAAAYVTRFGQPNQPVSQPIAIPSDDQAFLVLFGTGIRGAGGMDGVRVRIQGIYVPVFYAGPQFQFAGLDQLNVLLPPSLKGMGQVSVVVVAGGVEAAPVFVSIE